MRQSTYTPSQFEGYSLSVDILNILACVAVIFLHVNGAVWAFSYERYWTTSLVIECVFFLGGSCIFYVVWRNAHGLSPTIQYRNLFQTTFFQNINPVPFLEFHFNSLGDIFAALIAH